jgi:DNA-directed RNA polymerase specialized sigma24 family protein
MPDDARGHRYRGDQEELFRSFNDELFGDLTRTVEASRDIIEDACAHAWAQFLRYQPDRDQNWRGWLFRTAQREAWRLSRERWQTYEYREQIDVPGTALAPQPVHALDPILVREALRERLAAIAGLSEEDRRLVALRAEGYRYGAPWTHLTPGLPG